MMRAIEQQKVQDAAVAEAKKNRNAQMLQEAEVTNKIALDRKQDKLR